MCDRPANVQWFKEMVQDHIDKSTKDEEESGINVHDILIIPGDISHQLKLIESTFIEAKKGYDDVFFIPGNHEMWCTNSSKYSSSLDKIQDIIHLCNTLNVSYYPVYYPDCNLLITPLWSWYHASWDTSDRTSFIAYCTANSSNPIPFEDKWVDFHLCKWPSSIESHEEITCLKSNSQKLAKYFSSFNESWLERFINNNDDEKEKEKSILTTTSDDSTRKDDMEIISFSHFVPLQELIPKYLFHDELRKVAGSNPLKEQIYLLKPNTHVFAHTHLPVDTIIDDVRYIQWSLGTGEERHTSCSKIDKNGPLCIFDNLDKIECDDGFFGF